LIEYRMEDRKLVALIIAVATTYLALGILGIFTPGQTLSLAIFIGIILSILFHWCLRVAFAFLGIFVLLMSGVLDVAHLIEFAGLDIVVFLVGMMVLVGFLEERHFFEHLLSRVVKFGRTPARLLTL